MVASTCLGPFYFYLIDLKCAANCLPGFDGHVFQWRVLHSLGKVV